MKTKLTVALLATILVSIATTAQGIHVNTKEYFTLSTSIDPRASYKQKSIDIAAEIEYVGAVYAKAGFEYFPGIAPSYFDIHGAMGMNAMIGRYDKARLYSGIRLGRIFRENKSRGELFGLESGIDLNINEKSFIGLRATYDYRNDGVVLGWEPYWRASGFMRVGVKF